MRPRASSAAAKASSVGAKTVNGPSPESVSTRPASVTAATRVVKLPAPTATSTIVPGPSSMASSVDVFSDVSSAAMFSATSSLPQAAASMDSVSTAANILYRDFVIRYCSCDGGCRVLRQGQELRMHVEPNLVLHTCDLRHVPPIHQ